MRRAGSTLGGGALLGRGGQEEMGKGGGQKEERVKTSEGGTSHATNLNKGTINEKNDSQ